MKRIALLVILLKVANCYPQGFGNNWCFGDSAGISFNNLASPQPIFSSMDCRGSCTSISDSLGNLLFYSNTLYQIYYQLGSLRLGVVWNRYNQVMSNGDSLIGDGWFQEMMILPKPGNDSLYYLMQLGVTDDDGLYYSVINPYSSSGNGNVISKNNQIVLPDNDVSDASCAIKHANGRDWWYIIHNWNGGNTFYKFLITKFGISGPFTQSIGSGSQTDLISFCVSKDGNRIGSVTLNSLVEIYSFDRCTGIISNAITIHPENVTFFPPYSTGEFSPSGNLFYLSNTNNIFGDSLKLYQYDLNAANITTSERIIYSAQVPSSGGFLKLAPDNKIYWACLYQSGFPYADSARNQYNENLGVINQPDILGPGCDFQPFSFYLGGKRCYWGLPNNPNYNLGPVTGSICDSLTTVLNNDPVQTLHISVFPIPCNEKLYLRSESNDLKYSSVEIYNSMGMLMLKKYVRLYNGYSFDVRNLPSGSYWLTINSDTGLFYKNIFIIH